MKSTPAAETIAASEAKDELISICMALSYLLGIQVKAFSLIDAEDLFHSLTSQRDSVDHSSSSDVNCIRFLFKTELDKMGWIRESSNAADNGTKPQQSTDRSYVIHGPNQCHLRCPVLTPTEIKWSSPWLEKRGKLRVSPTLIMFATRLSTCQCVLLSILSPHNRFAYCFLRSW